jgi:hypothetical protein
MDGEVLHINWPSEEEASKLVSTSEKQYKQRLGMRLIKSLPGHLMNISYVTYKFLFTSPFFCLLIYILFCGIDIVFSSLSFENKPAFERYNMTFIKGSSWIGCTRCYFYAILSSIFLSFIWVFPSLDNQDLLHGF